MCSNLCASLWHVISCRLLSRSTYVYTHTPVCSPPPALAVLRLHSLPMRCLNTADDFEIRARKDRCKLDAGPSRDLVSRRKTL